MAQLESKRALVTGASRGIGAAIALRLAADGADVAITYEKSANRAAELVKRIQSLGRKAVAIQADSADPAAVRRAVATAAAELGGLDILVNNAGIARGGPVQQMPLEDIDAILAVNVRGVLVATQAALGFIGEGGRIVTIGSCVGERVGFGGLTVYAMSKSALVSFNKGLARELGPRGITANLVQPGPIDTDMNSAEGALADVMKAGTALGRYGKPEDVAAVVAFLAGPQANYVTGTELTVDGGTNA